MQGLKVKKFLVGILLCAFYTGAQAQCPDVYDYLGNPGANPEWYACLGTDYTLNFQTDGAVGNWSINWGDGSPLETGTSLAANTIVPHLYTLTVNEFTITFTSIDDGCSVVGILVMEEVSSPSIQLVAGSTVLACAPETVDFINSSTGTSPNTTFTWDFGDGTIENYDFTNAGQTIPHTYLSGEVDCNTTVTLSAQNKCNVSLNVFPIASLIDNITIWDIDDAAIDVSPMSVCSTINTFTFTNASELNCLAQGNTAQRYEYWNFGDYWGIGSDSIVDWTAFPPNPSYTLSFPNVGNFTVMMIDSNFCGADTTYTTVTVVPPPVAGLVALPTTVCTGDPITFSNVTSSNANAYLVDFDDGNGFNPTNVGVFNHTYSFAGTYDVELIAYVNGSIATCADTTMVTVTVEPGPNADFTLPQNSFCGPMDVTFTNTTVGAISWTWDFGNGNTSILPVPPTQSYTGTGDYIVSLIAESLNGCQSTKLETISIYDPPVANFDFIAACDGDLVTFNDLSTFNVIDPIVSYDWDFDDTFISIEQNPSHIYTLANTYNVEFTVSTANCSDSITLPVAITDASVAGFNSSITEGCHQLTVAFTNTSTNSDSYIWNFGDGNFSSVTSPTYVFENFTTTVQNYIVTLYTDNAIGCADTLEQIITVHPIPLSNFTMVTGSACAPIDVDFINLSNGATNYVWEFEPGQTSPLISPSYLFVNNTSAAQVFSPELVAISAFGCTDTSSQDLTVYPEPSYSIDLTGMSGCSPLAVTMPSVPDAVSYNWNFGNGNTSVLPTPTHIFTNNGTDTINYTIELIASNSFGCSDTASSVITVYPNSIANFSPDRLSGCSPLTIEFEDLSILGETYNWNFGDGDTASVAGNMDHTFVNAGNAPVDYNVLLDITSEFGCSSQSAVTITVNPEVTASFISDTVGCTPLVVNYQNTSTGASSYYWSMGDGNIDIAMNPNHTYNNFSQVDMELEAYLVSTSTFGCSDTAFQNITIYPEAIANFQTDLVQGCSPLDLGITNSITPGSTYNWTYGNGNTSQDANAQHEVPFINESNEPVTYAILLETITDHGCLAIDQNEVLVFPQPEAAFSVDPEFCSGADIIFTNNSTGATQYSWQFGDGGMSNAINPIHVYTNETGDTQVYPVLLTAESDFGCTHVSFGMVDVFTSPIADFNIDSSSICYPLYLEIANNSQYATEFQWEYGDGNFSNTADPLHSYTYFNNGQTLLTNTLGLTVTSENGCEASDSQEIQVIPRLEANFDPIDGACHPLPVNFNNLSVGALEYQWTLDVGELSDEFEPAYTYVNYGIAIETFEVTLVVSSYFGCTDTMTTEIIVHPVPDAEFSITPTIQTFPDATIEIVDNSVYGDANFTWDMGDGFSADTAVGTYTYGNYGTYFVNLVIDNGFCSDESTERVDIIAPSPISLFEGEGEGCTDLTVQFTSLSIYAETFIWNFGDGATSSEENPSHTYSSPGNYTVSLLVAGTGGNDISVQEDIVHAYPHAEADFSVNPPLSQTGDEVFFYNLSQNAGIYEWDFGNGTTTVEPNPTMVYDEPGIYDVTLIANNEFNCPDSMHLAGALEVEIGGYANFPNAFTPSVTGPDDENYNPESLNNNVFHPVFAGVLEYNLQIYNRWGELLFETDDINTGWNGYYKGNLVPLGVYVWRANVLFTDEKQLVKSGDITLLR
ncbi:MAG: gliding motility-associated-like protein [Flavobacteriales bacterium]|jgi:gliding motility-associated-like protein